MAKLTRDLQDDRPHLRVQEPQVHPRCHKCWNLAPICRCDGGFGTDGLPGMGVSSSEIERGVEQLYDYLRQGVAHAR